MRRVTRSVSVGDVIIGGDAPVVIQSMTNTPTSDVSATLCQIKALKKAGCELVRVAIPDKNALQPFEELLKLSPIPLIADIHFNYKLALEAITR
ncbi:MAG: flavodoxin-dependent (E)-4-hydroxy-3-methylbut-2-enyl-diphosphate synthase, partial [Firmicutes bacterium]|nr:flavodoxin-dependent (E)-4-hydroxy-3-methylbut-2-enyl-diphosphate synthase [Bacillota bacterium]